MNKLIIVMIFLVAASAHSASHIYSCKALAEKEAVDDIIFSDLNLRINSSKLDISGKFTNIGSTKSEKIKTTAIRKTGKPNDSSAKYSISNPFVMTVYLPLSTISGSPESIQVTIGYSDGSNGFVKATGPCTLKL